MKKVLQNLKIREKHSNYKLNYKLFKLVNSGNETRANKRKFDFIRDKCKLLPSIEEFNKLLQEKP